MRQQKINRKRKGYLRYDTKAPCCTVYTYVYVHKIVYILETLLLAPLLLDLRLPAPLFLAALKRH